MSAAGLREHRPVMIPYWKTARDRWSTRLAVSLTPRASMARRISSIAGASMSRIGFVPIRGNTSTSSELITLSAYTSVQPSFCDSNHSRATASKDEEASIARARLTSRFCSVGSVPAASSFRAARQACRASASETSGYTPNAARFSFPSNRYFIRQYFEPFGITSRYSPLPSAKR